MIRVLLAVAVFALFASGCRQSARPNDDGLYLMTSFSSEDFINGNGQGRGKFKTTETDWFEIRESAKIIRIHFGDTTFTYTDLEAIETTESNLNRNWRVHDAHGERYYSVSLIKGRHPDTYTLSLDHNAAGVGSGILMIFIANAKAQ
jgi:hypothetical protein